MPRKEITKRLREYAPVRSTRRHVVRIRRAMLDAADEIDTLRGRVNALSEALLPEARAMIDAIGESGVNVRC